jgi:hypothetical protein
MEIRELVAGDPRALILMKGHKVNDAAFMLFPAKA